MDRIEIERQGSCQSREVQPLTEEAKQSGDGIQGRQLPCVRRTNDAASHVRDPAGMFNGRGPFQQVLWPNTRCLAQSGAARSWILMNLVQATDQWLHQPASLALNSPQPTSCGLQIVLGL